MKEAPNTTRMSVTRLWTKDEDGIIEKIFTFKTGPENRYLYLELNQEPTGDQLRKLDTIVLKLGMLDRIEKDLTKDFKKCVNREEGTKYLSFFDRATYTCHD